MAARNYTPNFALPLMAKDLTYSLKEGERHGVSLAMVASALEQFNRAVAAGKGNDDFSAIVELTRNQRSAK